MEELENKDVKGKKAVFLEQLKVKYPDMDADNEEDVFDKIGADYAESADRIGKLEESERNLVDLFNKDPMSATLLSEWASNGVSPIEYLIRNYGDDLREALDDPERAEEIVAAHKDYLDKVAAKKENDDAFKKNLTKSIEVFESISKEKELTEQQMEQVWDFIGDIAEKYISGIVDADMVEMALKAINHDVNMEEAARVAEVKANNKRIDELKLKGRKNDELPPAVGGSTGKVSDSAGGWEMDADDIYKRGGFKRIKRG